ncbi:carcinoembryonic antigen-related cell adhesion molecule 3-like [Mesocricetus auratus]|uniref:Carcinoembryonic antigen-related cell adhesion molecule 3-like n=1 Tax=Mesocricetus auratus TaxID=10036 RepID=A0ABM2WLW2_MESAU|nr:carcinoembryonic antigen-related cell adhesion molecule 3-like [Mesocricetus auratus]
MKVYSVIPCMGCTLWQGLLLTASLLICWHPTTTAEVTIESVPSQVVKGENVLFLVHDLPDHVLSLTWFKGEAIIDNAIALYAPNGNVRALGPLHSGRETMYQNGSLWIQNVTQNDTGVYTLGILRTPTENVSTASTYLQVLSSHCECPSTCAQPTIEPVMHSTEEGASVLLVAHSIPENLEAFLWYKGAIVSKNSEVAWHHVASSTTVFGLGHSGREIVYSNGSLLLQNITCNDTGFYTLRTLNTDQKTELVHVKLQFDTCRLPPSAAKLSIESEPLNVVEGENALLLAHNIPEKLRAFSWSKEIDIVNRLKIASKVIAKKSWLAPAYKNKVTVYPNISLLFHNTTQEDTGLYVLQTVNTKFEVQEAHVYLHIYKPVTQPILRVISTSVPEQSSVVLTCLSGDTGVSFHWIFNNHSLQLTERMTLSPTKCQLFIDPFRSEDVGEYQCVVSNPVSSKTSLPLNLVMKNA